MLVKILHLYQGTLIMNDSRLSWNFFAEMCAFQIILGYMGMEMQPNLWFKTKNFKINVIQELGPVRLASCWPDNPQTKWN